jgi:hypothetical protein
MKHCGKEVGWNVHWFYCEVNKQERVPSLVTALSDAAWGQGHSVPRTENHILIHLYPRKLHSHCLASWGLDLRVAADDAEGWRSALELWTKTGENNQHHSYYILQCQVIWPLLPCVLHSWKDRKFLLPQPNELRGPSNYLTNKQMQNPHPKSTRNKNMVLAINQLVWRLKMCAVNSTAPYILTFPWLSLTLMTHVTVQTPDFCIYLLLTQGHTTYLVRANRMFPSSACK